MSGYVTCDETFIAHLTDTLVFIISIAGSMHQCKSARMTGLLKALPDRAVNLARHSHQHKSGNRYAVSIMDHVQCCIQVYSFTHFYIPPL